MTRTAVFLVLLALSLSTATALPTCSSLGQGWFEHYFNNHDSNSNGFTGGSRRDFSGNVIYGGTGRDWSWSDTSVPYHEQAYVAYELIVAGGDVAWDGNTGDDRIRVTWNGAEELYSSFAQDNYLQCYPGSWPCSGSENSPETGADQVNPISERSTRYDISHITNPHTDSTLTFRAETFTSINTENANVNEFRVCLYDPCLFLTCNTANSDDCEVDACEDGACVVNQADNGADCAANGDPDVCQVVQGTCDSGTCTYADADDGVACATLASPGTCQVADGICESGTCTHVADVGSNCDDGDFCNGLSLCDAAGSCNPGTPVSCTGDLVCDPSTGECVESGSISRDGDGDDDGDDDGSNEGSLAVLLGSIAGVAAVFGLVGFALARRGSKNDEETGLVEKKTKKKPNDKGALAKRKNSPEKKIGSSTATEKRGGSSSPQKKRGNSASRPRKPSVGGAAARGGRSNSASRPRKPSVGRSGPAGGRSASQGRLARKTSNVAPSAKRGQRTADFVSSLDFLASDNGSSMVEDRDLGSEALATKEEARERFVKLLTHKDLHMVVALIDATPMMWAEVTCRTIVAAFVANKQVVYLLRSLVTREIAYADGPSDAFKATSRAAKCFNAFAKVAGGAFLREALGEPLEAAVIEKLELNAGDLKALQTWCDKFLTSITSAGDKIPQEFQRVLTVLADSAREKWTGAKTNELLAGFVFVRLIVPSIAFPSTAGLADQALISPKTQESLILISKVVQKLAMGVKFSIKDGDLQGMNKWLDSHEKVMSEFIQSIARASAKNRQTMMELPKWGEESTASRFSIMSSASVLMSQSYLGAAADGIVVPQDIDALVTTALNNEDKFLEVLENGRDAAPPEFVGRVKRVLKRFKELNSKA